MKKAKAKVTVVQRHLPHYRLKFFEGVRAELMRAGVEFSVVYGQTSRSEMMKKDTVDLPWARRIRNIYVTEKFVVQPCWNLVKDSNLVIVEQANKLALNYLLLAARPFMDYKIGYIGHGYCHQSRRGSVSNRFKSLFIKSADWWFPYTDPIAEFLVQAGFPSNRISVLHNSIDTREMAQAAASIGPAEIAELKTKLNLGTGPVGVYCGGMYHEKELPFLLAACHRIREKAPGFQMLFIGDGPDGGVVRKAAQDHAWIHFLGPKFGKEQVQCLAASDALLMPGLVGLAVLDCFATGIPLLTTDYPYHSPEISYLKNGVNGMISAFDVEAYADMVAQVVTDPALMARLRKGCLASSRDYSMENMVGGFSRGVLQCLGLEAASPEARGIRRPPLDIEAAVRKGKRKLSPLSPN